MGIKEIDPNGVFSEAQITKNEIENSKAKWSETASILEEIIDTLIESDDEESLQNINTLWVDFVISIDEWLTELVYQIPDDAREKLEHFLLKKF